MLLTNHISNNNKIIALYRSKQEKFAENIQNFLKFLWRAWIERQIQNNLLNLLQIIDNKSIEDDIMHGSHLETVATIYIASNL